MHTYSSVLVNLYSCQLFIIRSFSYFQFNKHMAEKRRRARINTALEQMKSMVLCGMQKDVSWNY